MVGALKKRKPGDDNEAPPEEMHLERVIGLCPHPNGLAHSPSGLVVAYCAGAVVVLYDAKAGKQLSFLRAASSNKPFICVAFSSDGAHVAAGESGSHPSVVVWDASSGICIAELKAHKHGVASVCFSPSGKHIASCGTTYDGQICFWNWQSKALLGKERTQAELRSVTFSSDGSAVVSCGKGHMRVWTVNQVGGRGGRGAGGSQASVTLTGRSPILGTIKGHTLVGVVSSPVTGASGGSISASVPSLYAVSSQGVLLQMKTTSRSYERSVDLKVREAFSLDASEGTIAVACSEGIVRLFGSRTLTFKANLPRPAAHGDYGITDPRESISRALRPGSAALFPDAVSVCFDVSGDRVAVTYSDHSLYVWDIRNLSKVGRYSSLMGHAGPIWDIVPVAGPFGSADRGLPPGTFASASADGTVRLWNLGEGGGFGQLGASTGLKGSAYCKSLIGIMYVESEATKDERLRGAVEEQPVGRRAKAEPQALRCVRASPDGRHLAVGDKKGNLWVFDAVTQSRVAMLEAHDSEILSLDYSPCGHSGGYLLASGGRDGMVHVYDAQVGYTRLATLDDHNSAVTAVTFASKDSRMITCSADGTVAFRDLREDGDTADDYCQKAKVPGSGALYHMDIEATGRYVITTGEDRKLKVLEVDTARPIKTFSLPEGPAGEAVRLNVDAAGLTLAAAHSDRCVRLYDFFTGAVLAKATGHAEVVTSCFITRDFSKLITAAGDSCIFVYRMPEQLTVDSRARMAQIAPQSLPVPESPTSARKAEELRESKREKLLSQTLETEAQCPRPQEAWPEFDADIEPLTSQRLLNAKPLVSTQKLPKWAQAQVLPKRSQVGQRQVTPPCLNAEGDDLPSNFILAPPVASGKWAERVTSAELPLPRAALNRRFTAEPSDFESLDEHSTLSDVTSSPSHPKLADAAEAEDEIVYYSDNEKAKAAAGAIEDGGGKDEAFEIVDPPDDLDEVEEDGSAPSTGADRSEEEAEGSGDELPRSNLFKEHFGQLLDEVPPPPPPPNSREAARQSLSSVVRAADREGASEVARDKDRVHVVAEGKENRTASGGSESGVDQDRLRSKNRKGRLGAEIKEMRSRLVDLGLSYARQQSVARRGVGAPDSGNAGLAPMPESKVEEGGEKLKDLSIQVHKARVGEFCVGLDEAQGNIVAKAVDELQGSGNPSPFSPRASRTSGGSAHLERSRNSLERSRSIGRAAKGSAGVSPLAPPLPDGPPPLSAVRKSSTRPVTGEAVDSSNTAPRTTKDSPAADLNLGPTGVQEIATPTFTGQIKFVNPAYNMTPGSSARQPGKEELLRQLSKAAEAARPMKPGHQVVTVVHQSTEGPLSKVEDAGKPEAVNPRKTQKAKGSSPISAAAEPQGGGPRCSADKAAPVHQSRAGTLLSRFQAVLGKASSLTMSPSKSSSPTPETSAGTPTVAEDRGSPEITGRPIGDPKAASKPSGDSLAGEGRKGLDVLRGGRIRGLRRSMDSGAEALCEAWANLPDGGASLQKLHEAVAEVSALHRQLSPPGHDSGSSAALHKLLQAEVSKATIQLSSLGLPAISPASINRATSPAVQKPLISRQLPAEASGSSTPQGMVMVTPQQPTGASSVSTGGDGDWDRSSSSSISLQNISLRVESVLEQSAEKIAERVMDMLLEKKLPSMLQQHTPQG